MHDQPSEMRRREDTTTGKAGRLLRLLRPPTDHRTLLLGMLGLLLMSGGWTLLQGLFSETELTPQLDQRVQSAWLLWDDLRSALGPASSRLPGVSALEQLVPTLKQAATVAADPLLVPASPAFHLFELAPGNAAFYHALLAGLWALIVWSLVGCAIARVHFVQMASNETIGVVAGLRYAFTKAWPLIASPLTCLGAVAFFAVPCALVGLLYRVPPPAGPIVAGVLIFIPILASLVMVLILIGLTLGWPLMVATIAAENEDTFDALSRAYSYVYQRFWKYVTLAGMGWLVGTVGLMIVVLLAHLVLQLTQWGLAFGGPDTTIRSLFSRAMRASSDPAQMIHSGWVLATMAVAYSWVYGYFWTLYARIYVLLRLDVDGTPIDDIDLGESKSDSSLSIRPVGSGQFKAMSVTSLAEMRARADQKTADDD